MTTKYHIKAPSGKVASPNFNNSGDAINYVVMKYIQIKKPSIKAKLKKWACMKINGYQVLETTNSKGVV